jgi:hypothetical protein
MDAPNLMFPLMWMEQVCSAKEGQTKLCNLIFHRNARAADIEISVFSF